MNTEVRIHTFSHCTLYNQSHVPAAFQLDSNSVTVVLRKSNSLTSPVRTEVHLSRMYPLDLFTELRRHNIYFYEFIV